jgi:hypothetical protein
MDLTLKALEEAVGIRRHIEALEKRFASIFETSSTRKPRRRMSGAARAKIAAATRARWAKQRSGSSTNGKRKSGLTPAGRRRLSQMMKARWAAKRKAASKR